MDSGGDNMAEGIIAFIATVMGDVVCHYIIKWLDGTNQTNS